MFSNYFGYSFTLFSWFCLYSDPTCCNVHSFSLMFFSANVLYTHIWYVYYSCIFSSCISLRLLIVFALNPMFILATSLQYGFIAWLLSTCVGLLLSFLRYAPCYIWIIHLSSFDICDIVYEDSILCDPLLHTLTNLLSSSIKERTKNDFVASL